MDDAGLRRLAELARGAAQGEVDPAHDDAERARFVAAVARGAGAARAPRRARVVGVLAAAAALAIALIALWPAPRLSYTVEGAPALEGGYVAARDGQEARMRFTDGSSVTLAEGASLRVADVTPAGARVLLEHGRAAVEITPRPGARWAVEAGPFSVLVKGTSFHIAWLRDEQTLHVELHEGAVVVLGPLAPDGLPLRKGQRLVARLREGDVQIAGIETAALAPSATGAPASPESDSAPRPGDAQDDAAPEGPPSTKRPADEAAATGTTSWSKRVAAGDFQGVLAEAEQRGIEAVLQRAALDDLVALGDASRYAKRGDVAQRALMATRKRFPGSGPGRAAAFLIGRMTDDRGNAAAAIAWYDTYLRESPGGPFAAEALGRKMVALERTSGRAAARPVAAQYLKRYPREAYASVARDLVNR